jgi:hypothetical protein
MSTTPYLPQIEEALSSHAVLHLIDAVSEISHVRNWNGPSGRLLGKRLMEHMDKTEGRTVEDLTVRELNTLLNAVRDEYQKSYERSQEFWATRELTQKEGSK